MAKGNKRTIYLGLDYTDFTGGVTEVNRKMSLLDEQFKLAREQAKNYGTEADQLGIKQDYLGQKIALQSKKVEAAKKAYEEATKSQKATAKQLDALQKSLLREETALEKLNGQLEKSKWDAFVKEVDGVQRQLEKADAELELSLEMLKNHGSETDVLGAKYEGIGRKIELQKQKIEALTSAYEAGRETQKLSSQQMDEFEKGIMQEKIALEKLKGQLSAVEDGLSEVGKTTKSFGDEIRDLASSLGLEVSPALEAFASKFDGISKDMGNSIILIGGIVSSLTSFAIEAAGTADELLTLSKVTGVGTDELQKFQYASKFLDVSTESLSDALKELTNKMYSAKDGGSEAQEAFRKLHLSIKDGNGQMKDANEVFYEAIDALGKIKNQTERDAIAMKLFGESARNLNPLIEAGSDKLRQLGIEAENLGVVMGEESINKLGRLQDAMDKFDSTSESLKNNLALALLPILTKLFEVIGAIPVPVLQTIVTIATVAVTIVSVVKAIKSMTDTASGISKFFSKFDTSAVKTTAIVLGIVAALIALATVIAVIIGKSGELERSMNNIGSSIGQVTGSVNQAKSGVYKTAYHASGTTNFRGGRTWVGEGGPEIAEFPPGTKIYSAEESKNLGGTVNNYYMTVNLREMKEIMEMKEYFDRRQLEERRA